VSGAAVVPFSLFKNVGGKFTMAVMTEPGVLLPHAVIQKALAKDGLAGTEAFIYGYASCFDGRLNLYEVRSKENLERPDEVLARLGFGPFHEVEVNLGANGIKRFKPQ
jgi:hypothetical protein